MMWQRADLTAWGETLKTPRGVYRKTWRYADTAQNVDGCLFQVDYNGATIAKDVDGPTIDDAEDATDAIVRKHMQASCAIESKEADT